MAVHHSDLFCDEQDEHWDEQDEHWDEQEQDENYNVTLLHQNKNPLFLLKEQDFFWEDEELVSLFAKEKQTHLSPNLLGSDPFLFRARTEAVEWILKNQEHYKHSVLTAVLAVNYLDRYLCNLKFQEDKPWMIQLLSVTCFSLAAKMEEIHVPLLLDLQVEDSKYVFEGKTIQRMELVVMSNLEWRMNPVTPMSFLDHIIRRLGFKNSTHHWDFYQRSQALLLTVVADWRSVNYLPSVLATSTMLHVIQQHEHCNPSLYKNQLLTVLQTTKEEVNECYQLIVEISNSEINPLKRKFREIPRSPTGVMESYFGWSEESSDSWESCSESPHFKKNRVSVKRVSSTSFKNI